MNSKKILLIVALFFALGLLLGDAYLYANRQPIIAEYFDTVKEPTESAKQRAANEVELVADNLKVPWDISFLPNGDLLVSERPGQLVRIAENRRQYPVAGVEHTSEGGLLGVALHPNFSENRYVYLYYTTKSNGRISNRIDRYTLENDGLTNQTAILTGIPGSNNHDGGQIAFGPDGYLYATTGDASNAQLAQDTSSLAGKILRITETGAIPPDNPFGNAVYSYGHRNPQGLAWDSTGQLWSSEHGRSGVLSGFDEINRIEKGANYGWPTIQGDETRSGMKPPAAHSGAQTTWAPASLAFYNGSLWFAGLRGQSLYEAPIKADGTLAPIRDNFVAVYGRLRAVAAGPDGELYFSTSNTDGRGVPREGDDRILRILIK